jgi:hypothetical protein
MAIVQSQCLLARLLAFRPPRDEAFVPPAPTRLLGPFRVYLLRGALGTQRCAQGIYFPRGGYSCDL